MHHRGPDGEGYHLDGSLGLAHRRLSVIDLKNGRQPMAARHGSLWLSFNGEIYNYIELREELRGHGHIPRTQSDTEMVLLAYAQWGLDFAKHLNGMFAIALWDAAARRLVLCRDRMGIKPLYYAETRDGVLFASELKALRLAENVGRELDLEALDEFMTCGYVMCPRSLLKGIKKLPPGTLMVFEPEREPRQQRYWQLAFNPQHGRRKADWLAEIRQTFTDAVRLRLRSDVPLGTLLSGGVDSTLIAATMAKLRDPKSIHSFCVGVNVPGASNEFQFARQVAQQLGLQHHEQHLTAEQFGDTLLQAARLLDEPLVEPMVGQLLSICRFARERLTVVLSGEGADETWFGYPSYRLHYGIELLQRFVPAGLLHRLVRGVDKLDERIGLSPRTLKNARLLTEPLERRYLGLNYFDTRIKDQLYRPEVKAQLSRHDSREAMRRLYDNKEVGGPETISRMASIDCRAWLVDNTLMRSDLMSMASSLELRVPFLDHRLVEIAMQVPAGLKVRATDQKMILKEALADRLPPNIAKRRKMGFPTPLAQLFRGSIGHKAQALFQAPTATTAPLIDHNRLLRWLHDHRSGKADRSKVLFQMPMLEYWAQHFEEDA